MTREELDRLDSLLATATPAPWDYVEGRTLLHIETHIDHPSGAGIPICSIPLSKRADADLIVDLRNAAPALLAAARDVDAIVRDHVAIARVASDAMREVNELREWQREAAGWLAEFRGARVGDMEIASVINRLLERVKP